VHERDNKRLKYISFFYYTHVNKSKISNNAQSAKHKTDSLSATRRALSAKKAD